MAASWRVRDKVESRRWIVGWDGSRRRRVQLPQGLASSIATPLAAIGHYKNRELTAPTSNGTRLRGGHAIFVHDVVGTEPLGLPRDPGARQHLARPAAHEPVPVRRVLAGLDRRGRARRRGRRRVKVRGPRRGRGRRTRAARDGTRLRRRHAVRVGDLGDAEPLGVLREPGARLTGARSAARGPAPRRIVRTGRRRARLRRRDRRRSKRGAWRRRGRCRDRRGRRRRRDRRRRRPVGKSRPRRRRWRGTGPAGLGTRLRRRNTLRIDDRVDAEPPRVFRQGRAAHFGRAAAVRVVAPPRRVVRAGRRRGRRRRRRRGRSRSDRGSSRARHGRRPRRRRGRRTRTWEHARGDVSINKRWVAATPRPRRGYSVDFDAAADTARRRAGLRRRRSIGVGDLVHAKPLGIFRERGAAHLGDAAAMVPAPTKLGETVFDSFCSVGLLALSS